ncbi:MAG TPA: 4-hydroxy-3-methylbut-2-enyl diphosphate reductase [Phycisphaerales bacterium]|nr:4-hydroxy-3-methylbut-2-enyl diphosphate reductase [Phycisphaerales bacterium]
MHLILPNPRGFCAGVRMAVDVIDQVIDLFPGQTIYCYHEIVHNKHVVGRFQHAGVKFVDDLAEVPEGGIIVFSAHGISPAIRKQAADRKLTAIDATCPLVTKVHAEAIRYARQGYQILLVGHKDHQEVVGTSGEAPDATQVVESPEDIPHLHIKDANKLVYLTQTTLSTDDAAVIINALKQAFPNIKEPPSSDICYATTNRQHAVRQLAPRCDMVLVIGSRNSSNSVRLTEIAKNVGTDAKLLDDSSELDFSWFPTGKERVLISAGASAPEDLVADVCRALLTRYGGTIETADIMPEDVEFAAPGNLRKIMIEKGIDPATRRFKIESPTITQDLYGAVPLTIQGSPISR